MSLKVFNLCCANGHLFEGWFEGIDDFERQNTAGLVACPQCDSTEVQKRPSAPHIGRVKPSESETKRMAAAYERLMAVVRDQAQHAEDVGSDFAEEARRIAHGDARQRPIKGLCTRADARELWQEGIAALPVPESSGKTLN